MFPSRRTLGRAMRRKARRLALADAPSIYFSFVLCSQNVKICACLLAMPSFQCVGGGSVPPPMACRTLGQAARRKARRLALADMPSLYFSFVLCSQNVKSVHVCLQCPVFNASGAAACRPQWLARRWARRRAQWRSPGLGGHAKPLFFFRIVFAKRKNLCMFVCNAQFSMHRGWQSTAPNALPDAGPGERAQWRVAWPCGRQVCKIFVPCRVGKLIKSVSVCFKCAAFNTSGAVVCRPRVTARWAGRCAKRRLAWPCRRPECSLLSCFGRIACGETRCRVMTGVAMLCIASRLETLQTAPVTTH